MKRLLLIAALSTCVWPTGTFADDPPVAGADSRKTATVPQPAETSGARVKVFTHPETGEILTREQWEALGIENEESEAASRPSPELSERDDAPTTLKGKRIDLENGDYAIVVDNPDPETAETRAWFDEEGKAHIRCSH